MHLQVELLDEVAVARHDQSACKYRSVRFKCRPSPPSCTRGLYGLGNRERTHAQSLRHQFAWLPLVRTYEAMITKTRSVLETHSFPHWGSHIRPIGLVCLQEGVGEEFM